MPTVSKSESNEFNNTLARVVSIGPDLVVVFSHGAHWPREPWNIIAVSDTIKNQGGGVSVGIDNALLSVGQRHP